MSGNPPPIVLRPTASSPSSLANNPSIQTANTHPPVRSPIVIHPQTVQPTSSSSSSSSPLPFRSVIVKSHRDSIQQVLTTTNAANSVDMKTIVVQPHDILETHHHPNKRIALESIDLHNSSVTFSAVPKSEALNNLQSPQSSSVLPIATTVAQPLSSIPAFPTLHLIRPATFVHANDISSTSSTTQQLLLQQHGNIMIAQPILALQVQNDAVTIQKENSLQRTPPTDSTEMDRGAPTNHYIPIQYQRKPCNCTKSMCLKLYCDCFANGLYCQNCSCLNCHNDMRHEEVRQKAITATLERNPAAFKSKMYRYTNPTTAQPDRPLKGCNCKKSSCHKRYCECYESRVPCTSLCKCVGCKNTEQSVHPLNVGFYRSGQPKTTAQTPLDQIPRIGPPVESAAPNNVFNMEVTEALASCLLITGQQCEMNQMNEHDSQEAILKEFQRCMHQIVQSALGRPISS